MKIDPNPEIVKSVYPDKSVRPGRPAGDPFAAMLKDAINEPSGTNTGSEKPKMISNISNIQLNPLLTIQDDPMVARTERFLDILEEYQGKLKDPQTTLREIHPLIQKMETEKEFLTPFLDSLPPGNGLKEILNDAMITSTLETMKFNRGDYVDS